MTDANIVVPQGSIVTVIGGNGAGKSTLLNAVMGAFAANGQLLGFSAVSGR